MSTVYLYIPFSKAEESQELLDMASRWRKAHEIKQDTKAALAPSEEEYEIKELVICTYGDQKINNVKADDTVYILGHGMHETSDVSYSQFSDKFTLTQDTVASRIIEDGLPADTAFKLKLFYCDESDNALERAQAFFEGIQNHKKTKNYDNIQLDYYPGVMLSLPILPKNEIRPEKAYKKAIVKSNLLELEKGELKNTLNNIVANMDSDTLKEFLASLGLEVIIKLLTQADVETLKKIQEKAKIANTEHFLNTLSKSQTLSLEIYQELGRASEHRKSFKGN